MAWIVQQFNDLGQAVTRDANFLYHNGEHWAWGREPFEFDTEDEARQLADDFNDYYAVKGYSYRCEVSQVGG